jgi:hypothetical protein
VHAPVVAAALIGAFKEVFLRNLAAAGAMTSRQELAEALFEFGIRGLLGVQADESNK